MSARRSHILDARLAQLGLTFLLAGLVLSAVELIVLRTVTVPALGLAAIGAVLVPAGVLGALMFPRPGDDGPADDNDGGDGGAGRDDDPEPPPPSGGLEIDWAGFERDFQAYAEARAELVTA